MFVYIFLSTVPSLLGFGTCGKVFSLSSHCFRLSPSFLLGVGFSGFAGFSFFLSPGLLVGVSLFLASFARFLLVVLDGVEVLWWVVGVVGSILAGVGLPLGLLLEIVGLVCGLVCGLVESMELNFS